MWPELGLKKFLLVAQWGKDCNQATVSDADTREKQGQEAGQSLACLDNGQK